MRLAGIYYTIGYILPDFAFFILNCFHMIRYNWWTSDQMSFIINRPHCSLPNAYIAWLNSIPWMMLITISKYAGLMMCSLIIIYFAINLLLSLCRPGSLTKACSRICFYLKILFVYVWSSFKNFILGFAYDEAFEISINKQNYTDDYQRDQVVLKK